MNTGRRLGLLGGTFDPVHYGHLDAAEAARQALALDEVWLLPSHVPPHRSQDPVATPFHRFALAALAISDRVTYRVSDIELQRTGRTYTVDTLRSLREQGWTRSQRASRSVSADQCQGQWKLLPQAQPPEAAGLSIVKPDCSSVSTKSIVACER